MTLKFEFSGMPKGKLSPKEFIELANNPEAKWVKVKIISDGRYKYQLKTGKSVYTLTCNNAKINQEIANLIPQHLKVDVRDKKRNNIPDEEIYQNYENPQDA